MTPESNEVPSTGCNPQRLRDFLASDHYHLEDAELIRHLDGCDSCRKFLESEAGDQEQWGRATEMLRPCEFDRAGRSEFSTATSCGPLANPPTAVKEVLESLVPSEDPHHLGRLGTYEVTGLVGVGGMGIVLKAIDPSLDRVVAVKVMNPRLANNEQARKRFAREAKAAAAVLHPNVIPIHSVSSESKLPYLVMACIRGGSLQKRLENEGPLPLIETLRIGSQVAAGLNAAHEQGLIHRDIKPENILLEEGVERVTITDFGLARAVDDNTVTQLGAIAGTPQYMSPEQARGEQLDQQSDLFSLGCVLYALCTGRPPFRDETSYGVMRKIIDETPPPIQQLNPQLPEWMQTIASKLMAKNKADRFQSANEVHKLLEACLSHVQQPHVQPLPSLLKNTKSISPMRKNQMKVFGGITLVTVSVILGLIGLSLGPAYFRNIQSMNQKMAAQDARQVRAPLSAIDSILFTMANTPFQPDHRLTFLNLHDIGKDKVAISMKAIEGGVRMRFSAQNSFFPANARGTYLESLRTTAESLSVPITERSTVSKTGTVEGVTFELDVTGAPNHVAATVRRLISEGLQVNATEECSFQFHNMPRGYATQQGEEPRQVNATDFLTEAVRGDRVYLGENENLIYLIPATLNSRTQVQWNHEIWVTDVRDLSAQQRDAIRKGWIHSGDKAGADQQPHEDITHDAISDELVQTGGSPSQAPTGDTNRDRPAAWVAASDYQPSELTSEIIQELVDQAENTETPEWVSTPDDKLRFKKNEIKIAVAERICKNLGQLQNERPQDTVAFVNELQGLYLTLKPLLNPTESTYQVYSNIAEAAWPLVLNGYPEEFHDALVALTEPYAAIRTEDRIANAGRPTELLGLDLQAVHALALARKGDVEAALRENMEFAKKLEVNQAKSRLPNLPVNFLKVERTPKSLLQQSILQHAIILASNDKVVEAVEVSATAGQIDTQDATETDRLAIQDILLALAGIQGA